MAMENSNATLPEEGTYLDHQAHSTNKLRPHHHLRILQRETPPRRNALLNPPTQSKQPNQKMPTTEQIPSKAMDHSRQRTKILGQKQPPKCNSRAS